MEPISLSILIIKALLEYGPATAKAIQALLKKDIPTQEDWDKLFAIADEEWKEIP